LKVRALWLSAAALVAVSPAHAQVSGSAAAAVQASAVPAASAVAAFYDRWNSPVWYRGSANSAAISQLISVLQRAPFDGFAQGPQLAGQVQLAAAQAQSGKAEDIASAERVLSTAWVEYVQALRKKTPGMITAGISTFQLIVWPQKLFSHRGIIRSVPSSQPM